MSKDNRGLSLLEIIIVVSMMVILSAVGVIGVSMVSGKPAEQCAESIRISLAGNRTTALGKYKTEVVLLDTGTECKIRETSYKQDDSVEISKTSVAGGKGVTVEYVLADSYSDSLVYANLPDDGLRITFDRGTGAMDEPSSTTDLFIKCSKAGKSYVVHVYHLTGKAVIVD